MDFTIEKYKELCDAVINNYKSITIKSYLTKKPKGNFVLIRHDVDRKPKNAVKMAEIEHEIGIRSTYYFRMNNDVFVPKLIKKIANLGHEIGYHYEVLDKAKGDFKKAIEIFKNELQEFREVCDIKTICMHGNPLTPWKNCDIWKKYDFNQFEIIGEPYISLDYDSIYYFTDTGRKWNSNFNLKDSVGGKFIKIRSTDDLINSIKNKKFERVCILIHPNRWSDNFAEWMYELIWQNIKNIGKIAIKKYRGVRALEL